MALFGWENAVEAEGVSLAASAAAAGFGPELLRVPIGSAAVAWQTPGGTTAAALTITAPSSIAWRAACLARTNLSSSATLRVRVGSAANITSAPTYDSGVISAGVAWGVGQALHVLPAAVAGAVLRLDLADPANPEGLLNVPLCFAGPGSESAISPGSDMGLEVRRGDTTTRGGVVLTDALSRARGWQIRLGAIREDDLTWLDALEAAAAAGRNVLFVPRPLYARAAAETVLGLLAPGRRGFIGTTGAWRTWSATITERL